MTSYRVTDFGSVIIISETLSALPYLDAVIRECLRLFSPATSTVRISTKADVIPLSDPIVGRDGKEMSELPIGEGVQIFIRKSANDCDHRPSTLAFL